MISSLPIFPLNLVVVPGEELNLHIFEPRYKELIRDVRNGGGQFGIVPFLNGKVADVGTLVTLNSIEKTYSDGRMDISTEGVSVFDMEQFINPLPNKMYGGAEVELRHEFAITDYGLREDVMSHLYKLYALLKMQMDVEMEEVDNLSYFLLHRVGLDLEGEYQLLKLRTETERLTQINNHIKASLPVIEEMERMRTRAKMNGHFKYLDPIKF